MFSPFDFPTVFCQNITAFGCCVWPNCVSWLAAAVILLWSDNLSVLACLGMERIHLKIIVCIYSMENVLLSMEDKFEIIWLLQHGVWARQIHTKYFFSFHIFNIVTLNFILNILMYLYCSLWCSLNVPLPIFCFC